MSASLDLRHTPPPKKKVALLLVALQNHPFVWAGRLKKKKKNSHLPTCAFPSL